ncbi:MAG: O-antigen ligase family protein [Parcubacteria group bacterium]|nr:O-antigen ligase family protein [Parcubacteria group bacterium]
MPSDGTLNKILRYGIIGGIFLLPFLPFVVAKMMYFPFITGKNFAFRIIVELILGGWLILAWRDARYRLRFSWIWGTLIVFLGIITAADIFGENFLRSFWSNYERMDGLITLLHLVALFAVAGSMLTTRTLWTRFLQTSLGVSVLVSIYSIFQLLGFIVINQGGARVDATFGNATYLASYLLFHIFFAAFLFAGENKSRILKWTYGAAGALNFFILFNTATRGAILAFVGGVILTACLMLFWGGRQAPSLKKPALAALIALLILISGFMAVRKTEFIHNSPALGRLSDISLSVGESRFLLWGMSWEGVKEHPLLGWGQDNFMLVFSKYYDPRMYAQEPWFDRAHNVVFDWLIAGGFLGLLAYLSIFLALLYAIWVYPNRHDERGERRAERFNPAEKSILTGLLAAYFFQNLFVFDNVVSYVFFFLVLAFIHGQSFEKAPSVFSFLIPKRARAETPRREIMERFVAPLVVVTIIFGVYFFNIKGILANRALLQGIDLREAQGAGTPDAQRAALEKKLRSFERAIALGYLGRAEAREQLAQVTISLAQSPVPQEIKRSFFTLAQGELLAQIGENSKNARYHLFLVSLLASYSMPKEALFYAKEALAASPKKQDIYFLLADAYLNAGDFKGALKATEDAFALEPKNSRALNLYVTMLIRTGNEKRAEELLAGQLYRIDVRSSPLVAAYVDAGNFQKVAALWLDYLSRNPNDVQAHISLAAAYVELGRRADAIRELEKAAELEPRFKEQAAQWIAIIRAGGRP